VADPTEEIKPATLPSGSRRVVAAKPRKCSNCGQAGHNSGLLMVVYPIPISVISKLQNARNTVQRIRRTRSDNNYVRVAARSVITVGYLRRIHPIHILVISESQNARNTVQRMGRAQSDDDCARVAARSVTTVGYLWHAYRICISVISELQNARNTAQRIHCAQLDGTCARAVAMSDIMPPKMYKYKVMPGAHAIASHIRLARHTKTLAPGFPWNNQAVVSPYRRILYCLEVVSRGKWCGVVLPCACVTVTIALLQRNPVEHDYDSDCTDYIFQTLDSKPVLVRFSAHEIYPLSSLWSPFVPPRVLVTAAAFHTSRTLQSMFIGSTAGSQKRYYIFPAHYRQSDPCVNSPWNQTDLRVPTDP
jgi:hypothetical protein